MPDLFDDLLYNLFILISEAILFWKLKEGHRFLQKFWNIFLLIIHTKIQQQILLLNSSWLCICGSQHRSVEESPQWVPFDLWYTVTVQHCTSVRCQPLIARRKVVCSLFLAFIYYGEVQTQALSTSSANVAQYKFTKRTSRFSMCYQSRIGWEPPCRNIYKCPSD